MSKEQSAYEKMLQSGEAFKEVDMTMPMEPNLAEVQGMGEKIDNSNNIVEQTPAQSGPVSDYSHFDSVMEERVNNLKNKMNGGKVTVSKNIGRIKTPAMKEIESLKKRIEKLEEALIMVMDVQQQLFE